MKLHKPEIHVMLLLGLAGEADADRRHDGVLGAVNVARREVDAEILLREHRPARLTFPAP